MNERIEKLAELCTSSFVNMHGEWEDDFDKEKFAELIIEECAKIADDGHASDNFGNGITGHQLMEHFGVGK